MNKEKITLIVLLVIVVLAILTIFRIELIRFRERSWNKIKASFNRFIRYLS